jgi:hypothetical protein
MKTARYTLHPEGCRLGARILLSIDVRAHPGQARNALEGLAPILEDEGQLGAGLFVFDQRQGADLKRNGPLLAPWSSAARHGSEQLARRWFS